MKKRLSGCTDCGDDNSILTQVSSGPDNSILTQVSSGPDVILLCTDCFNLKYSKEIQNEISYDKKEKN